MFLGRMVMRKEIRTELDEKTGCLVCVSHAQSNGVGEMSEKSR
jgi:hypothetical protein